VSRRRTRWLVSAAIAALVLGGGFAQETERYLLTGHFQLRIDDTVQQDARVYMTQAGSPKLLVVAEELPSPIVLTAGERTVRGVEEEKLVFPEDEPHVARVPKKALKRKGPAKISGPRVYFHLPSGRRGIIEPREPIVGQLSPQKIVDELPEFARNTRSYEPHVGQMRLLQRSDPAVVHVFFGTWCRHCEKVVPRLVKLAQQLDGDSLSIRFHAIPEKISEHPLARQLDVKAVPTAVVMRGGNSADAVISRLEGDELKRPEAALSAVLFGGR
jgi:thiol-disulfide isomerase/thioredoxin